MSVSSLVVLVLGVCMNNVFVDLSPVSGGMPGAPSAASTSSCEVVQAAALATETFNYVYSRALAAFKTVRIISAQTQVVAGTNYILQVQLRLTQCRKDVPNWILEACPLHPSGETLFCKFVVTDVPWEYTKRLTSLSCYLPFRT